MVLPRAKWVCKELWFSGGTGCDLLELHQEPDNGLLNRIGVLLEKRRVNGEHILKVEMGNALRLIKSQIWRKAVYVSCSVVAKAQYVRVGPSHGPAGSVTVAPKTMAGEVKHDEHQYEHTDHGEEYLDS
jgi:hypothetical protein